MAPKDMETLVEAAIKTLHSVENDAKFPKDKIQHCGGIALVHSYELGVGISGSTASGVMMSCTDGKWSAPLAISTTSAGVGSLGFVEKQTLLVLNKAAVDDVASAKGIPIKFSAAAGLTNAIGGEAAGGTGAGKAGLETCYAFSNGEGGIITLELKGTVIKPNVDANKNYYHSGVTNDEILSGKVDIPKDSKANELLANVSKITAS